MRLPVLAMVAIVGLGLIWGTAFARQLWLPTVENPFCSVPTYLLPELPEQAISTLDRDERPVIVVSAMTMTESRVYGRFLMAHECCHHTLGHVTRFRQNLGHVGPQPFFYIAPALKGMELEADCCAAKLLKLNDESDTIEAAQMMMSRFGSNATGAHYPTGIERVENIRRCALGG